MTARTTSIICDKYFEPTLKQVLRINLAGTSSGCTGGATDSYGERGVTGYSGEEREYRLSSGSFKD